MFPESLNDLGLAKLGSGIAGAIVSMRFISGTWPEKVTLAAGGCALSYYAAPPVAQWLAVSNAEGLIGFLIGLFGMSFISKIYEVIQALDAKRIAADGWEWVVRKWKA